MKYKILGIFIIFLFTGCKSITISEVEQHYVLSERGNDKYYLVKLIRKKQKEGILGEKPMMIFNGQPVYVFYKDFNGTPTTEKKYIKSVKIFKAEIASRTWGAAGKYGLVEVDTSGKQEKLP